MPISGVLMLIISILFLFNTTRDEKWIDKFLGEEEKTETSENQLKENNNE
jgi:hypothetical protein